ncbi:hypothetical protein JWG45_11730 [Leptospira sp. 201903070]|uniref:Histidine kinase N-terminal 7TM region domain-containing protein n=1 Tax=Leptospira ainlahdjerensis TaxID=2810033 RepID=A0ABS2UG19_9LEPT|nr:hypothetical protein [Leptospira ainlahdjerensis]MBM9577820.1 hypothetical protein [Leptospira ainlahdjerensis]
MNYAFIISFSCSFFILILGVYVFRFAPLKYSNIRLNYLLMTLSLGQWVFFSSLRYFIPKELIDIYSNYALIPSALVPFFLTRVTTQLIGEIKILNKLRYFQYSILSYILISCLFCKAIIVNPDAIAQFKPLLAYHVLIFYSIIYIGASTFWMLKNGIQSKGAKRVRSHLLMLGTLIGLFVSILFVYVLPFFGIFLGLLSCLGILPATLFWSVAILQYNAFETKSMILKSRFLAKRQVPLLSRLTFRPVLWFHFLLDPLDYRLQLRSSRAEVVQSMLQYHLTLQEGAAMSHRSKIRKVAAFFESYFK